ncbi:MAG: retropepsin-like domain-containing protein [Candidatus Kapabacteria bacterium]|nr:retropepsin-like domain-containing protein [Candidatus Kapabacteria bacterium]
MIVLKGNSGKGTEEYDIIFDTGAAVFVLSEDFVSKQGYALVGKFKGMSPEGKEMGEKSIVKVDNFSFKNFPISSDATVEKKEMIFSPTAVGIIGLAAFEGYIVSIDYQNRKLVLTKGVLKAGRNVMTLNESPILEGNILLNGKAVKAHFDCGAPSFISIPVRLKDKCAFKTDPRVVGKAMTIGGEMDILAAQFDGTISVGSVTMKDPQIELVTANFPAVNIGYRFFIKNKIRIDVKSKRMSIEPNS